MAATIDEVSDIGIVATATVAKEPRCHAISIQSHEYDADVDL